MGDSSARQNHVFLFAMQESIEVVKNNFSPPKHGFLAGKSNVRRHQAVLRVQQRMFLRDGRLHFKHIYRCRSKMSAVQRIGQRLPTVLATNLDFPALQQRYGERVFSRLTDSATTRVIRLEGENLRWRRPPC